MIARLDIQALQLAVAQRRQREQDQHEGETAQAAEGGPREVAGIEGVSGEDDDLRLRHGGKVRGE